jgi:hypothetical protein
MTAVGDTSAKTAPAPFKFDPATVHPEQYTQGQAIANNLIAGRSPADVRVSLAIARAHLENWPAGQAKLTATAWALEKGFADTLEEYVLERGA